MGLNYSEGFKAAAEGLGMMANHYAGIRESYEAKLADQAQKQFTLHLEKLRSQNNMALEKSRQSHDLVLDERQQVRFDEQNKALSEHRMSERERQERQDRYARMKDAIASLQTGPLGRELSGINDALLKVQKGEAFLSEKQMKNLELRREALMIQYELKESIAKHRFNFLEEANPTLAAALETTKDSAKNDTEWALLAMKELGIDIGDEASDDGPGAANKLSNASNPFLGVEEGSVTQLGEGLFKGQSGAQYNEAGDMVANPAGQPNESIQPSQPQRADMSGAREMVAGMDATGGGFLTGPSMNPQPQQQQQPDPAQAQEQEAQQMAASLEALSSMEEGPGKQQGIESATGRLKELGREDLIPQGLVDKSAGPAVQGESNVMADDKESGTKGGEGKRALRVVAAQLRDGGPISKEDAVTVLREYTQEEINARYPDLYNRLVARVPDEEVERVSEEIDGSRRSMLMQRIEEYKRLMQSKDSGIGKKVAAKMRQRIMNEAEELGVEVNI